MVLWHSSLGGEDDCRGIKDNWWAQDFNTCMHISFSHNHPNKVHTLLNRCQEVLSVWFAVTHPAWCSLQALKPSEVNGTFHPITRERRVESLQNIYFFLFSWNSSCSNNMHFAKQAAILCLAWLWVHIFLNVFIAITFLINSAHASKCVCVTALHQKEAGKRYKKKTLKALSY